MRDADPDRGIARVQEQRRHHGRRDAAAGSEHGDRSDLGRSGERRRGHQHRCRRVEMRSAREHTEPRAERGGGRDDRRREADASTYSAT